MYEGLGNVQIRPIEKWPGELTRDSRRLRSPFRAPWSDTTGLLRSELHAHGATVAVLGVAMRDEDFRNDGRPRAHAKATHPGVVLSFNPDGDTARRLQFATDRYLHWQDNLRAIALGLEALRKVDRYGITSGGQQYAGFRALPSGAHDNHEGLHTREQAAEWLRRSGLSQSTSPELMLRDAIKATHPDRNEGVEPETFRKVMRAKELIAG